MRTSSFFRMGSQTSVALVVHMDASFLLGVVPPMSAIMDSLRGFHKSMHF
jgi:hypothetical protein